MSDYPQSSITFLEIPIFSIVRYNQSIYNKRNKHKKEKHTTEQDPNNNQNNMYEQDQELQSRILSVNTHIKWLNQSAGRVAPDLNKDLYKSAKVRTQHRRGPSTPVIKNKFSLYSDGIHPTHQLSQVWLRKLER